MLLIPECSIIGCPVLELSIFSHFFSLEEQHPSSFLSCAHKPAAIKNTKAAAISAAFFSCDFPIVSLLVICVLLFVICYFILHSCPGQSYYPCSYIAL